MRRFMAVGLLVAMLALGGAGRVDAGEARSYLDWSTGVDAAMSVFESGDFERAAEMLDPLAEAGDADAQFILGRFHHEGFGVDQNDCHAVKNYRKAAAQQHAIALRYLGELTAEGICSGIDDNKVRQYYEQAVELGEAGAAILLSVSSISTDWPGYKKRLALDWAQRAWRMSSQGQELDDTALWAATWLGIVYHVGIGVSVDLEQAEKLYLVGAIQGFRISQFGLGNLYLENRPDSSFSEGLQWILLSSYQGHPEAIEVRDRIFAELSQERAASAWKAMLGKFSEMAANPDLVLGEAADWCFRDKPGSAECLRFAFDEHFKCNLDVGSGYYKNRYVGSPAYHKCRSEAHDKRG